MESETTPLRSNYDSYSAQGSTILYRLRKIRCCSWLPMGLIILLLFGLLVAVVVYKSMYQKEGVETVVIDNVTINDGFERSSGSLNGVTFPLEEEIAVDSNSTNMFNVTKEDIEIAMDTAKSVMNDTETLEKELAANGLTTKPGTASFYHQKFRGHPKNHSSGGYKLEIASSYLKLKKKYSKDALPAFNLRANDIYQIESCNRSNVQCDPTHTYRSMDGSCNNLDHPNWGKSFTPYTDIIPKDYEDGISRPRLSVQEKPLPSARLIQSKIHTPDYYGNQVHTIALMQFGQFIDHDITATAASKTTSGESIQCCTEEIRNNVSLLHPECYPIEIPSDDPFFSQHEQTCMEFVRSAPFARCNWGPRSQFNTITHFLDASNIYGSSLNESLQLRQMKHGLLKFNETVSGHLLPVVEPEEDSCDKNIEAQTGKYCFRSGDSRVNEVIFLTAQHTIWMRQHNRIAGALRELNEQWDDEKLYQESRRIIIAMMQHITYNEYIPAILGTNVVKNLINSRQYDPMTNPSITSAFATAAFRFGHSQVQGLVEVLYKGLYTGQYNMKVRQLHEYFFQPQQLYEGETLDGLLKGSSVTKPRQVGRHFNLELTNHLFQPRGSPYGLDLVSINIQRGRDHGLPGYTSWRRVCGLSSVTSFDDLTTLVSPEALVQLKEIYAHVDDIDLYTGGLAEIPANGSLVSETFLCILVDGFLRLKIGDRFWYDNPNQPYPLSEDQLQEIKKVKLSRIYCDNSNNLQTIQPDVFYQLSDTNIAVSCLSHEIPRINLVPWEEGSWDNLLDIETPS